VVAFQVIAAALIPQDLSANAGLFFFLLAALYLVLAVAVGLDRPRSQIPGAVLAFVTIVLWILVLASGGWGTGGLPRSGPFFVLALLDAMGILLGLMILRDLGRSLRAPASD
jgi:hypothetical protein